VTSPILKVVGPYKVVADGEPTPINLIAAGAPTRDVGSYPEDPAEAVPSGGFRLKGYQRRAVSFMMEALSSYGLASLGFMANGCGYFAQPGMGKTAVSLQACHRLDLINSEDVVLVVGPLQAQKTWCGPDSDPAKHFGLRITPLDLQVLRKDIDAQQYRGRWIFVHYEILDEARSDVLRLAQQLGPTTLICDESHYLGNPQADRTQATRSLSGIPSISRRIILTATPLRSSRSNLWPQLDIMQPGQWGTSHDFSLRYLGLEQQRTRGGHVYWEPTGPTNTEELRSRLNGFTLKVSRGTAAAYGGVVIKRTPVRITLSGDERAELQEAILSAGRKAAASRKMKAPKKIKVKVGTTGKFKTTDSTAAVGGGKYPEKLVALTHAISGMADVKVRHAARAVVEMTEKHRYTIVFTERRASAKSITAELRALAPPGLSIVGPIDGAMPVQRRWDICDGLATNPHAVLVATAGSIGVSNHALSVATGCLIVTPFWNPDGNLQVEGRLLSEGDAVQEKEARYLLLEDNPIDTRILERITLKERDTADILGLGPNEAVGGDLSGDTSDELDAGALWDLISSRICKAETHPPASASAEAEEVPTEDDPDEDDDAGAGGEVTQPEPSRAAVFAAFVVPARDWPTAGAPDGALSMIDTLEHEDEDLPVALARHPELGWAVLAERRGELEVVWSEQS